MKANLFINYYQDREPSRQRELDICVLANIYNPEIDRITIFIDIKDKQTIIDLIRKAVNEPRIPILQIREFQGKPTYNDYFKLTEDYPEDINIISNLDVMIDKSSLNRLKSWHWGNYCLALSRWDFYDHNLKIEEAVHFNRADSQDTWVVKGVFPQIPGINFGLGIAGCDNRIADLLSNYYQVINPSLNIKTYHYHLSQIRHYINKQGVVQHRVDPPYKLITPTALS